MPSISTWLAKATANAFALRRISAAKRDALQLREQLRVAQALDRLAAVEHDGRRDDGPGERPAPRLIDAADVGVVRDEVERCRRPHDHAASPYQREHLACGRSTRVAA